MMDGETYNVVLYARVSTDDKGQTNDTQIREMTKFCKRNGWTIADNGTAIYTDEQTAKNDKRPGFRELKGRLTENDIDYVVARNQDRISREPKDYQAFLDFCKTWRVRVRFTDNGATPETPDGVIIDSVQSGLAKADNMKRSSGTKKGMNTRKLNGKHIGRKLSFCFIEDLSKVEKGYEVFGITNRDRCQNEGEHKTVIISVKDLIHFARQGYSIPATAKILGVSKATLYNHMKTKGIDRVTWRMYNHGEWLEVEENRVQQVTEQSDDVQQGIGHTEDVQQGFEPSETVQQGIGSTRVAEDRENGSTRVGE